MEIYLHHTFVQFELDIILRIDFSIKAEMYNTISSYYKYASIPRSSFYKTNILVTPINTREKNLKYFIHFASVCEYQPL